MNRNTYFGFLEVDVVVLLLKTRPPFVCMPDTVEEIPAHVCVHKHSPLAKKDTVTSEELSQYPLITFTYTSYAPVDESYSSQYTVDSFEQQKSFMKQENCFCRCTLKEFQQFFQKNYTLIPLVEEEHTIMHFIAIYQKNCSTLVSIFLEHYIKNSASKVNK